MIETATRRSTESCLTLRFPVSTGFPTCRRAYGPSWRECLAKDPQDRYQAISDFSDACRDLLKDMAEDSQLMLAELQAALPRLRKAAAQPGASRSTIRLCQDIQDLLGNEGKTDYASLDRLMAALADHYPTLKAISGEPVLEPSHAPVVVARNRPLRWRLQCKPYYPPTTGQENNETPETDGTLGN